MGYYGLGPGMNSRMADKLTQLEQLLRNLPLDKALEILELLEKICKNVCHNQSEPTFRQVDVTTAETAPLLGLPTTEAIMIEIGWQRQGDFLVLPAEIRLDFQGHVVKIITAKDFYKKEAEKAKKFKRIAADPAKAAIQQQMAIDRLERQAQANAQRNAPATSNLVVGPAAAATPPATAPATTATTPAPPPTPAPTAPTPAPAASTAPAAALSSPAPATTESPAAPLLVSGSCPAHVKEENDSPAADNKGMDDIRAIQRRRYEQAKAQAQSGNAATAVPAEEERPRRCFCLRAR